MERLVPAQDARLGALHLLTALCVLSSLGLLAALARGGVLFDPADAGAIGVEVAVHRLEEGVLQVNVVRLFSSTGR